MQFSDLHFKQPHILHTSDEFSRSNFFLQSIDSRKKFDRESSSEVRKMLGCLKCKYENCIFICRRLSGFCTSLRNYHIHVRYKVPIRLRMVSKSILSNKIPWLPIWEATSTSSHVNILPHIIVILFLTIACSESCDIIF